MDEKKFLRYLINQRKLLTEHSLSEYLADFLQKNPSYPLSIEEIIQKLSETVATQNEMELSTNDSSQSEFPTEGTLSLNQTNVSLLNSNKTQDERYQILENLGSGGMGVVQRVKDRILGREVALKKMKGFEKEKELSNYQKMMLWRFHREASITAILEHPNIVPLYDMQQNSQGEFYFTMRKISGNTFKNVLNKPQNSNNFYDETRLLSIFLKVCDAISYAHSKGIIHRDLKPDNMMVGEFGEVYVMDWGIAKQFEADAIFSEPVPNSKTISPSLSDNDTIILKPKENISPTTHNEKTITLETLEENELEEDFKTIGGIGTPGYMSPEQEKDAYQVMPQTDIYALGMVLRECYTRLSPFQEIKYFLASEAKKRKAKKTGQKFKTTDLSEKIPRDILAIIEKATKKKWSNRYQTVQELAQDLERFLKNIRVSAREYSLFEKITKWLQRNKQKVLTTLTLVLLCSLFLWYSKLQKEKEREEEKQTKIKRALKTAREEQQKASQINLQGPQELNNKTQHLLNALNKLNVALNLIRNAPHIEQQKLALGEELIRLCFESKNYLLANYVAKELERLTILSPPSKQKILTSIHQEQTKNLRRHQARLNYWIQELKKETMTQSIREKALLEISKMPEEEIFQKLIEILQEGTLYFTSPTQKRTAFLKEFYQTMVDALGRLENPKAGSHLIKSLQKMVLKIKNNATENSIDEIRYMESLAKALESSKAPGFSKTFKAIRSQLRHFPFWAGTQQIYHNLTILDGLDKKKAKTAEEFEERGEVKMEQYNFQGAIQDLKKAIQLNPKLSAAHYHLGMSYLQLEQEEQAIESFTQAILLEPKDSDAYNSRGVAQSNLGDFPEAIADYTKAIKISPKNPSPYYNRGLLKQEKGELTAALEDLNKAIQLNPLMADFYNSRGVTHHMKQNYHEAVIDLTRAIHLQPKLAIAYRNRGETHISLNKLDAALLDFTKTLELTPDDFNAYFYRASVKASFQDATGAIEDLTEVLRLNPEDMDAYYQRGMLKDSINKQKEAIKDLKVFLRGTTKMISPEVKAMRQKVFQLFPQLK